MYIHTSQLGSVYRFPSPHFDYLLPSHMYVQYGFRRSTKGGSVMGQIPEDATAQAIKEEVKKTEKEKREILLFGERDERGGDGDPEQRYHT